MRIVIETRVALADQGTREQRVELEFDGDDGRTAALALDSLHIVKHLIAALDGADASQRQGVA